MVEGFQAKSCSVPFWNLNNCWIDGRCKKTNWSSLPTRLMNSFKTIDLISLLKSVLAFLYLNEKMNTWSIKQNYCRYTILQKFPYPLFSVIKMIQKGRKEEKYLIKSKKIFHLQMCTWFTILKKVRGVKTFAKECLIYDFFGQSKRKSQ